MPNDQPGQFHLADWNNIDEGKLKAACETLLAEAAKRLDEYEKQTGDLSGKVKFAVSFILFRRPKSKEFFDLEYDTSLKAPREKMATTIRGGGGKLLVSQEDLSLNDADQMLMPTFDRYGKRQATINKDTGEIIQPDLTNPVAGTITAAN